MAKEKLRAFFGPHLKARKNPLAASGNKNAVTVQSDSQTCSKTKLHLLDDLSDDVRAELEPNIITWVPGNIFI